MNIASGSAWQQPGSADAKREESHFSTGFKAMLWRFESRLLALLARLLVAHGLPILQLGP